MARDENQPHPLTGWSLIPSSNLWYRSILLTTTQEAVRLWLAVEIFPQPIILEDEETMHVFTTPPELEAFQFFGTLSYKTHCMAVSYTHLTLPTILRV